MFKITFLHAIGFLAFFMLHQNLMAANLKMELVLVDIPTFSELQRAEDENQMKVATETKTTEPVEVPVDIVVQATKAQVCSDLGVKNDQWADNVRLTFMKNGTTPLREELSQSSLDKEKIAKAFNIPIEFLEVNHIKHATKRYHIRINWVTNRISDGHIEPELFDSQTATQLGFLQKIKWRGFRRKLLVSIRFEEILDNI